MSEQTVSPLVEFGGYFRSQEFVANALGLRIALNALDHTTLAIMDRADQAFMTRCYWSDEWCECKELATVHNIKSEREFCERHFEALEGRR